MRSGSVQISSYNQLSRFDANVTLLLSIVCRLWLQVSQAWTRPERLGYTVYANTEKWDIGLRIKY